MGFASSEPDPEKGKAGWTVQKKAKAQYGLKMPEGSSPTGGALVAQIAAGMFWPYAVDAYLYSVGGETVLKGTFTAKFDLAGAINWGMVGSDFSAKVLDAYVNIDKDMWVTWFFNDTPINLQGRLIKLSASLRESTGTVSKVGSRLIETSLHLKESAVHGIKVDNNISARV